MAFIEPRKKRLRKLLSAKPRSEATPGARLDAQVMSGARIIAVVLAASLLGLHLPVVILMERGALATGVPAAFGLVAVVLAAAGFQPGAARHSDLFTALIATLAVSSLLVAAALPSPPNFANEHHLFFIPPAAISIFAFAPLRVRSAVAVATGTTAAQALAWRAGAFAGDGTFHALCLAFLVNTWGSAILLCHLRRRGLLRLFRREQELTTAHARLRRAHRQTSRTLEQLRTAQDMLLHSERMAALGRMAAGLAHEINTPLAACRSTLKELDARLSELAASVGQPSVTDDDLREIVGEATDGLTLARATAGRAAAIVRGFKSRTSSLAVERREIFEVVAEVRDSIAMLGHQSRRHGVPIELDVPQGSIWLDGDRGKLAQIVVNLLDNALFACGMAGARGPIRLEIQDGEDLLLRVVDQGPGVDAAILSRLFEPLQTTKTLRDGTGLGLSISRQLAESSFGGTLRHEPTAGGGATFCLRIPATRVVREPPPLRRASEPPPAPQWAQTG